MRKIKFASEWYRKELASHKRSAGKPMRPISYKPNAEAKAVEYAQWLLARDGVDLDALGAAIRDEWNVGAKPKSIARLRGRVYGKVTVADDCPILPHVQWDVCAAGVRPHVVHWSFEQDGPRYVYSLELPHWDFCPPEPVEQLDDVLGLVAA